MLQFVVSMFHNPRQQAFCLKMDQIDLRELAKIKVKSHFKLLNAEIFKQFPFWLPDEFYKWTIDVCVLRAKDSSLLQSCQSLALRYILTNTE